MNNQSETQESRRGARILVAVIVVILAAALVYVQTRDDATEMVEVPPVPEAEPTPPAEDPGARERGDQARAIIARLRAGESEEDLDAIFAKARELQAQGHLADAYLLYFYGARKGDPAAALMLGRMYDPTGPDDPQSLVDEPIAAQALKWYRVAADAGSAIAEDYLANLRGWAEDAAARGDPEARQLLLIWQ
ncbi:MAG: hypothetical protein U5S82_01985 [Gammaproteobacteria bacterium]|nr:hypothetical protein [Gammaproteobacteria bacterium]